MAMSDCLMLYITPREYLETFDLEIAKLNFIIDVLTKNFASSGCKVDSLRRLAYKFKEEVFPYNTVIFHQGDPSNHLMIVKSGSVEVSKIGDNNYGDENKRTEIKKKRKTITTAAASNNSPTKAQPDHPADASAKKANNDNQSSEGQQHSSSLEKNPQPPTSNTDEKKKDTTKEEGKKVTRKNKKGGAKDKLDQEENTEDSAIAEYNKYYGSQPNIENEEDESPSSSQQSQAGGGGDDDIAFVHKGAKNHGYRLKIAPASVLAPVKYLGHAFSMKLGIIGVGEILGMEDFVRHKYRSFQAKSVAADTVIYYVSKKKLEEIIELNDDTALKRSIKECARAKVSWYEKHCEKVSEVIKMSGIKKDDDSSDPNNAKKRFEESEEVDFKSVVNKLFNDARGKLLQSAIVKEQAG